jgi:hypothetical protein
MGGVLSKSGKYKALIGLELLEYEGGKNETFETVKGQHNDNTCKVFK